MYKAILKRIESGRRFLVCSHGSPDGDAIASTLALTLALREMDKDVVAFNRDGVPASFSFLPGADTIVTDLEGEKPFDLGFVLDAGELRRAGDDSLPRLCDSLANIDHHPHSEKFGEFHLVDTEACATGVLIYRLLREAGHPVSFDVATCIYTAILADTGSFRYSNANPEAFAVAGEMVDKGVDVWNVSSALYENQEEGRLRLLAEVLPTLEVSSCGRLAAICSTLGMMSRTGTGAEQTDGFVNYPRSVSGVEVAIYFREIEEGKFKVGFRSKGRVDVGSLARALGGGGHHNAAGAVVEGPFEQVKKMVFGRVAELLDGQA
ncbi:MAG: bifunctional oligoribonuclease/PAP phosphatase NrnA [Desulfuromonadales bacterium]|nr:bifunctional oligoribonuclease/PAP phosphatase NrnA [Desulfuromonadales bacterium]NIR33778.1 bifunctional oligoribonuclease/PAP phosphatase NrnA [Desulfuromonadales bacterium]NIS42462.1 bifunctional oligoribonuclease/PAP phosphatase NrnA [Desulfuromonadales bacterium]